MKFQCDRCKTRYSIADDKVRGKVLKIRCKNCSSIITVREGAAEATPAPELIRQAAGLARAAHQPSTSSLENAFQRAMQAPIPDFDDELPGEKTRVGDSPDFAPPEDEWYVS